MSSPTAPTAPSPAEPQPKRKAGKYEALIDSRLRQTRRQVRGVDTAAGLIALVAGGLAYLLVGAVIDHWIFPGGLGFVGRLLLFAGLAAAAGFYFFRQILPLLIHRINPIFAAYTLEQGHPSTKNSLVNLLFLRRQRAQIEENPLARQIYRGLERRAADDLARIPAETAVDRSQVIRLGAVLAGVLAICSLYLMLSPKNPLVSFGRIIWPWARIVAPTRVTIEDVRPGDVVEYQGQLVLVSAEVDGVGDDESVMLYYTTADGQSVDQAIPMQVREGGYRHECQLPPGKFGLQQDVRYYLAAGDYKTRQFAIEVETAPTILVEVVHYDYPDYTGIPDQTAERAADLRAIEGTQITLGAIANQPIDWAVIEMNCDPRRRLKMAVDGTSATGRFILKMNPDDPTSPEFNSYQLRFAEAASGEKRENREPIRHRIQVIPDVPPKIQLVNPPPEEIRLPENGILQLNIYAEDPDFALRRVAVRAERDGRSLPIEPLLDLPTPEQPLEGPLEVSYRFEPARLGLRAGDEVTYWAQAQDNKEPIANRSETERRWILIVADEEGRSPQEQPDGAGTSPKTTPPDEPDRHPRPSDRPPQDRSGEPSEDRPQDRSPDQQPEADQKPPQEENGKSEDQEQAPSDQQQENQQPGDQQDGSSQPGSPSDDSPSEAMEKSSDQQQGGQQSKTSPAENGAGQPGSQAGDHGQPSAPRSEPIDGKTNPGDVFEEVLEQREKDSRQNPPDEGAESQSGSDPSQGGKPDEQQTTDRQPAGKDQSAGGQPQSDRPDQGQRQPPPQDGTDAAGTPDKGQSQEPSPDGQAGAKPTEPGQKPQDDQAAQGGAPGEPSDDQGSPREKQEKQDPAGATPEAGQDQGGDVGKPSEKPEPTPSPQGANQPRDQQPGDAGSDPPQEDGPKSPSISPKQSDSQSEDPGDRSGGGGEGGGQDSDQSGTGTPGSSTPADQGGQSSDQQGEGETSTQGGDQMKTDRPADQSAAKGKDPGPGRQQPGGEDSAQKPEDQQQTPSADHGGQPGQPGGGQPGGREPGGSTSPGPGVSQSGGKADEDRPTPPQEPSRPDASDPNLEFAKKQTDLALEYLEDQLARQEPNRELLDRLGWTREDLVEFVRQWQEMKAKAAEPGAQDEDAGRKLDEAILSLGLRPSGTALRRGGVRSDQSGKADSRRFDPPAKWGPLFRAYTEAISNSNSDSGR